MGRIGQNEIQKSPIRFPFNVELRGDYRVQQGNIIISDMTLIRPWVYGNALCTKRFDVFGDLYQVRQIAAARIAEQGYFVDVYA